MINVVEILSQFIFYINDNKNKTKYYTTKKYFFNKFISHTDLKTFFFFSNFLMQVTDCHPINFYIV